MGLETLIFKCVGIENGEDFPIVNTGRGQNISPEFIIKNLSPRTKTLAIILEVTSVTRNKRK